MDQHHPLARYFMTRVELGPLNGGELQATLVKSLAGTGVTFSPKIRDLVYEYTEGHPYEMQVLCYHLFHNQLSRKVDEGVWAKALGAALEDLGVAVFDRMYGQASPEEAKVLLTISKTDPALSVKEIQLATNSDRIGISAGNIPKYLQRLTEKKLLSKSGRGFYAITDKMFRAYLRTHLARK